MQQVLLCCLVKKIGDWSIWIHPPHGPKDYHRKHVHITKRGLQGEYSWNIDGTRHDDHRFPTPEKCISSAKQHAASALGIPIGSLQLILAEPGGARISVKNNGNLPIHKVPLFNAYVSTTIHLVLFGSPSGLVIVLNGEA
jgi:hypothetical protein